jgi:retron-type reverse transcriptase
VVASLCNWQQEEMVCATKRKPYEIDKKVVMKAYQTVKANAGAAGVDKQTIEQFEQDLKGNLYGSGANGTVRSATLAG